MACCAGARPSDPQEVQASLAINKVLVSERANPPAPQCLLLGTGESGKSTIFKQMRLLHGVGYSEAELMEARVMIRTAIQKDVVTLAGAARSPAVLSQVGGDVAFPDDVKSAIDTIGASADGKTLDQLVDLIELMWADPAVRRVYNVRHLYHLSDGAHYFLDKIRIVAQDGWLPTSEDLIRVRVRTSGVVDQLLTFSNMGPLRMVDVGGQRNERRKWAGMFEGATAVIFVTAISDYGSKCFEDDVTDRIADSLQVFGQVCAEPMLANAAVILFLNKCDLFQQKLKTVPFADHFDDYFGDGGYSSAGKYLKKRFMTVAEDAFKAIGRPDRMLKVHFTTAIDRDNVRKVFDDVKDAILTSALKQL
ncbi:G-protein alpha subunit [Plasmodiophora brassicae]